MNMVIQIRSHLRAPSCRRGFGGGLLGWVALTVAAGCSLQDFDYLTNGGASSGSTSSVGGTVAGGGSGSSQGGSSPGGSGYAGASLGGTTAAIVCPPYTGTGGSLVTPPSNDFENNVAGWMTTSQHPVSLVNGDGNACQGSGYLLCSGAVRTAGWDGPGLDILPYVVAAHKYDVTIAVRFDPQNAPAAAALLDLTCAISCQDTTVAASYTQVQQRLVLTTWSRLSGSLPTLVLPGCSSLLKVFLYVESDNSEQNKLDRPRRLPIN